MSINKIQQVVLGPLVRLNVCTISYTKAIQSFTSTNGRLKVVMRSPALLDWLQVTVGFSKGPRYPAFTHEPNMFSWYYTLNDRRRTASTLSKIGIPFFLPLPSCLFLSCFLILLILLMRGKVYPNPGPIFFFFVYVVDVTWRGWSVQCCTCSKLVYLRCTFISSSKSVFHICV